jgi:segregation and condensation protein B
MPETTTLVVERQSLAMPAGVKELVEALIFAAEEPLTLQQIRAILQEGGQESDARTYKEEEIESVIATLNEEYQHAQRPYRIIRIAGGFQFATTPEYAAWIGKLHKEQGRRKLSQSSLETLAIIAYRQPITRPDIEAIRGVDCDYVLGTLLEKKLVTIVGRAPTPGRPLLYGTTPQFLKHFGLNDISDLPRPREIEELLADARYETERRMLEAQEQAEKAKKAEEDFKSRLPHIPKKKPDLDDSAAIIPKKLGRPLTARRTEETKENLSHPDVSPPALDSPNKELAETREEPAEPTDAVGQPAQASTPTIEDGQTKLEIPLEQLPKVSLPDVTEERSTETEIEQSDEDSVVETTTAVIDETPQSMEIAPSDLTDGSVEELKTVDVSEHYPGEPQPVVPQLVVPVVPVEIEERTAEEATATEEMISQDLSQDNQTQEQMFSEIDTELRVEESAPAGTESGVLEQDETSMLTREEQTIEVKTPSELHPEETTPPFDATTARADVAPPVLAPIVEEVREPAQPKSRWTRFKEKIQGFIKKVFG